MPQICTATGCEVRLPYNHFVSVNFEDYTRVISSDCSGVAVLFTDDEGLVDQSDLLSGAYLSTAQNERKQNVFGMGDVIAHWQEGSRTYQELFWYFTAPRKKGFRPNSIVVAYWDRAGGESLVEAKVELDKCFCCYMWVSHVSHGTDDVAIMDTGVQIAFAQALAADEKIPCFPTGDEAALAASNTEIATIPGQAGSTSIPAAFFLNWIDAGCTWNYNDAAGMPQTKPWVEPHHIMGLGIGSSYKFSDLDYNFTFFQKPPRFGWPGAHSSKLTQSEIINVTGTSPDTGYLIDSARSVNVYVASKSQTRGFIEGMTADGRFIDQLAKQYVISADMRDLLLNYVANQTSAAKFTDETDLASLDTLLMSRIRLYISKDIFPDLLPARIRDDIENFPDYQWSTRFENIIAGGDGFAWVLARQPLDLMTEAEQSQRFGPIYTLCYISNQPLHRPRMTICSTIKPSQIAA